MFFDFIFQNGDFYYEQIHSSIWDFLTTLGGIGIPVCLFYLGLRAQKKKENTQKEEKQYDRLRYFATLVENIITICDKQKENCKTFSSMFESNPIVFPELEIIIGTDIKRVVVSLNQEETYHAYLKRFGNDTKRINTFRQIYSYLDYVDKIYDEHLSMLDKYKIDFKNLNSKYKEKSENLMDYIALLINRIKFNDPNYQENKFWNFINNLILNYYDKITEKNIQYDFDSFINPLKHGIVNDFRDITESEEIMFNAKNTTYLYTDIVRLSNEISTNFIRYSDFFDDAYKKLKEFSDDLVKINAT